MTKFRSTLHTPSDISIIYFILFVGFVYTYADFGNSGFLTNINNYSSSATAAFNLSNTKTRLKKSPLWHMVVQLRLLTTRLHIGYHHLPLPCKRYTLVTDLLLADFGCITSAEF